MDLEIGDIVYYTFHSDYKGEVKVRAKVIDTYIVHDPFCTHMAVSLRYEYLEDI